MKQEKRARQVQRCVSTAAAVDEKRGKVHDDEKETGRRETRGGTMWRYIEGTDRHSGGTYAHECGATVCGRFTHIRVWLAPTACAAANDVGADRCTARALVWKEMMGWRKNDERGGEGEEWTCENRVVRGASTSHAVAGVA